jgi:hypothetical protein
MPYPPPFPGVLWAMKFGLRGSMMILLLAVLSYHLPRRPTRWALYPAAGLWLACENDAYIPFLLGLMLADVELNCRDHLDRAARPRCVACSDVCVAGRGSWADGRGEEGVFSTVRGGKGLERGTDGRGRGQRPRPIKSATRTMQVVPALREGLRTGRLTGV